MTDLVLAPVDAFGVRPALERVCGWGPARSATSPGSAGPVG